MNGVFSSTLLALKNAAAVPPSQNVNASAKELDMSSTRATAAQARQRPESSAILTPALLQKHMPGLRSSSTSATKIAEEECLTVSEAVSTK